MQPFEGGSAFSSGRVGSEAGRSTGAAGDVVSEGEVIPVDGEGVSTGGEGSMGDVGVVSSEGVSIGGGAGHTVLSLAVRS